MANQVKIRQGTNSIVFADHAADFSSGAPATASNSFIVGTPTIIPQFDMTTLTGPGGAFQSIKVDLLDPRAARYTVDMIIEHVATPAAGYGG